MGSDLRAVPLLPLRFAGARRASRTPSSVFRWFALASVTMALALLGSAEPGGASPNAGLIQVGLDAMKQGNFRQSCTDFATAAARTDNFTAGIMVHATMTNQPDPATIAQAAETFVAVPAEACTYEYVAAMVAVEKNDWAATHAYTEQAAAYARRAGISVSADVSAKNAAPVSTVVPPKAVVAVSSLKDTSNDWFSWIQPGNLADCNRMTSGEQSQKVAAGRSCAEAEYLHGESLRRAGRYREALAAYDQAQKAANDLGYLGGPMQFKLAPARKASEAALGTAPAVPKPAQSIAYGSAAAGGPPVGAYGCSQGPSVVAGSGAYGTMTHYLGSDRGTVWIIDAHHYAGPYHQTDRGTYQMQGTKFVVTDGGYKGWDIDYHAPVHGSAPALFIKLTADTGLLCVKH